MTCYLSHKFTAAYEKGSSMFLCLKTLVHQMSPLLTTIEPVTMKKQRHCSLCSQDCSFTKVSDVALQILMCCYFESFSIKDFADKPYFGLVKPIIFEMLAPFTKPLGKDQLLPWDFIALLDATKPQSLMENASSSVGKRLKLHFKMVK